MRGSRAKKLRKAGLKSGPQKRTGVPHVPSEKAFDHKAERRSRRWKKKADAGSND